MEERPRLGVLREIATLECESSCAGLEKRDRHDVMKQRGGTVLHKEAYRKVEQSGE